MTGTLLLLILVIPACLVTVSNGQPNMQDLMWFKKFLKDTGYNTGKNGTKSNGSTENYENPALFIMFTKFMKWVAKTPSVCGTKANTGTPETNQGFSLDALLNSKLPAKKTSLELVNPGLVSDLQNTNLPPAETIRNGAPSSPAPPLLSQSPPPPGARTQNPLLAQFKPEQLSPTWPQALTATPKPGSQTPTPTVNPIQLPPSWEQTHTPTSPQPQTSESPQLPPEASAIQSPEPQSHASQPPVIVAVTTQQTLPAGFIQLPFLSQGQLPDSQQIFYQQQQTQPPKAALQLQQQQQPLGPTQAPPQQTLPPSQPQLIQTLPAPSQQGNSQTPTNPLQNLLPQLPMEKYSKEFMKYLLSSQNGNSGFPNPPQVNKTQLGPPQAAPTRKPTTANPVGAGVIPSVSKPVNHLTGNQAPGPVDPMKFNVNPSLANNSLQMLQQFQSNPDNFQNLQMMQLQQNLLAQMKNQMPNSINNIGPKQNTKDNNVFLDYLKWNVAGQNTNQQQQQQQQQQQLQQQQQQQQQQQLQQQQQQIQQQPQQNNQVANIGIQNNQIPNNGGRSPAMSELKQQALNNIQLDNLRQSYVNAQNLPIDINVANILKQTGQNTNTINTHLPGNVWMTPLQSQQNRLQAQTTVPAFQSIPDFGSTQPIITKTTRALQGQKMTSPFITIPWSQNTVSIKTNSPLTTTSTTTVAPTTRPVIKDQPLSVLEPRGHQLLSGLQPLGMISKSPNAAFVGGLQTSTVSPLINGYTTNSYNNLGNFNNGNKNLQHLNQNNIRNFGQSSTNQFQDMSHKSTIINQGQTGNGVVYNDFVSMVAKTLLEMSKQGGTNRNSQIGPNNNNNFNNQYQTTLPPPTGYTAGHNYDPWNAPYTSTIPPPPGHTVGNAFDPWNQKQTTTGLGGFFPEIDMYAPMNPSLDYAVHHPNGKNWREMNEKTGHIQMLRNEVTGAEVYVDTTPALGKGVFVIIGTKCWIGVNAQNPDFILGIRNITSKAQTLPTILANPLVINAIEQEEVKRPTFTRISPTLMEFCEGKQAFLVKPISGQVDRDAANCNANCCGGLNCCSCYRNIKKQCIQLAVAKYCIIARPQPAPRTATRPRTRAPRPRPAQRPPP